jgi:hypothetical protein
MAPEAYWAYVRTLLLLVNPSRLFAICHIASLCGTGELGLGIQMLSTSNNNLVGEASISAAEDRLEANDDSHLVPAAPFPTSLQAAI